MAHKMNKNQSGHKKRWVIFQSYVENYQKGFALDHGSKAFDLG